VKRYLLPLVLFFALLGLMGVGLGLKPRELPSPLVGQRAPAFTLPSLHTPSERIEPRDMLGRVWLLNVWASWCAACRQEHALMVDTARSGAVPIYGLNYRDQRDAAMNWLRSMGDPYVASMSDTDGLVGMDYGVYGVPETYVVDKAGVIRHKVIGPLTPEIMRDDILPLVRKLGS